MSLIIATSFGVISSILVRIYYDNCKACEEKEVKEYVQRLINRIH